MTLEIIQQYSFPLQLCFAMWCTRAGSDISFYKIPLFARDRPLFIWKVISGNNIRKFIFLYSNILDGLFSRGIAISWAIALWAKLGQILSLGCWGKDIQTRCRPMIPRWPSWIWPSLTEDSSEVWSVDRAELYLVLAGWSRRPSASAGWEPARCTASPGRQHSSAPASC